MNNSIERLRILFTDKPELLEILELGSFEDEQIVQHLRQNEMLFREPVNLYMTGRTGSGKTTIGNLLLDDNQVPMNSTGYMDCTDYLGVLQTPSLVYYDTPGPCSNETYENINRAVFGMPQLEDDED